MFPPAVYEGSFFPTSSPTFVVGDVLFFFWKDYICREEKRKTTWWGIMQGGPENSGHLVVFLMIAILTGGILVWF
jgi:hypothetical protein